MKGEANTMMDKICNGEHKFFLNYSTFMGQYVIYIKGKY